jgi:hypothetical protein
MFDTSNTEVPTGMRALITCAECETPLAGVDTVGQQASIETEIEECPTHPDASYVLTVEKL